MMAEGYRVQLAKSGREVLDCISRREPYDLLILDPDLPDMDKLSVVTKLQDQFLDLPMVVHIFSSDYSHIAELLPRAVFVEKSGSSVEGLKQVVHAIYKKTMSQKIHKGQWSQETEQYERR